MQQTSDTSSSSSPCSDESVRKKRKYPKERRRTRMKRQRYPEHQITLDLNNRMLELSHSPSDDRGCGRLAESGKTEFHKRDPWKDLTDISTQIAQIKEEVQTLGTGFAVMLTNVALLERCFGVHGNFDSLHSVSDYMKIVDMLDSHFSLFDQETRQSGIRLLMFALEGRHNEEVDELIGHLTENLDFFDEKPVQKLVRACQDFWSDFKNAGSPLSVRELSDVLFRESTNVLGDDGEVPTISISSSKQFDLLNVYLQTFRSEHWKYRKRLQNVLQTLNWYRNSTDQSPKTRGSATSVPWLFQPNIDEMSFPEFGERHARLFDLCQRLLQIFKSYTSSPGDCISLYKAFRMQTLIWDQGMKAYIDELLAVGQRDKAISYLEYASKKLDGFQKDMPELHKEWNKMRQGLQFYKEYLQGAKKSSNDERNLLPNLPTESVDWPPPLKPPLSEFERWPLLKGAFDIYNDLWNAPLSSIVEIVLKGWSWVGQGFGFCTYARVSWLIWLIDIPTMS